MLDSDCLSSEKVLTKQSCIAASSMHSFTLEVGSQRAFAIWTIQQSFVAVGTESSR